MNKVTMAIADNRAADLIQYQESGKHRVETGYYDGEE